MALVVFGILWLVIAIGLDYDISMEEKEIKKTIERIKERGSDDNEH